LGGWGGYFELMFTRSVLSAELAPEVVVVVTVVVVPASVAASVSAAGVASASNFAAAAFVLVVLDVSPPAVVLAVSVVSGLFFGVFPKNNLNTPNKINYHHR
jgi:hypothetical protein